MQSTGSESPASAGERYGQAMYAELESRVAELEAMDEDAFGEFSRGEWFLCVTAFLLAPYLGYIWFWPA